MKTKKLLVVLSAMALLAGSFARAGDVSFGNAPVGVDTTNRHANGALGAARNSADANQLIGCEVVAYAGSTSEWGNFVVCYARSAAGVYVSCFSTDPKLIATTRGLSGDGFMMFSWDESGRCTTLAVDAGSSYAPKR